MSLKSRVAALEKLCPPPPPPDPEIQRRQQRFTKIRKRYDRLVHETAQLLTPEEYQRLGPMLCTDNAPFRSWTRDLMLGCCRLPPELTPQAFKALLLAWGSPDCDGESRCVCTRCGLEYPHRKDPAKSHGQPLTGAMAVQGPPPGYERSPEFFHNCPNCGACARKEMVWAHRIAESNYPWMDQDGCVGRPY
jgi:uncharacterized C2H2 Zn-finger protein